MEELPLQGPDKEKKRRLELAVESGLRVVKEALAEGDLAEEGLQGLVVEAALQIRTLVH